MGARVGLTVVAAYVGCALLTLLGGLMLSAQIGIGDPSAGINYTLTSITAVVLGGASIFGGRGSFVGALLGALLLQEIATATPFLGLDQSWQYFLPGILILFAAGAYSRARGVKTSALASARPDSESNTETQFADDDRPHVSPSSGPGPTAPRSAPTWLAPAST